MEDFYHRRYDSIQLLRGIAAVFIIFEHIRFLNCGAFGVDIFFCISGFMMMLSTASGMENYWIKRLTRILPLYYLMTCFTFVCLIALPGMFEVSKADPVQFIKSLCFIPFDIGGGVIQPLMRVGWTTNYEMFFYLVFYIAGKLSAKYRGLLCSIFLVALSTLVRVLSPDSLILGFYGDGVVLEFVLGIGAFYICRQIFERKEAGKLKKAEGIIGLIIAAGIFAVLAITKHSVYRIGFCRELIWGLPAMLIVTGTFTAGLFLKAPKALAVIGNMSFSIYLIHYYPVLLLDRKVFDFSSLTVKSAVGVPVTVAICLGLSYISWRFFETKLYRRGIRTAGKKAPEDKAAKETTKE